MTSALIDIHKRLQIEYNNIPITDANSKNVYYNYIILTCLLFYSKK
jgi:hypothetical protein